MNIDLTIRVSWRQGLVVYIIQIMTSLLQYAQEEFS